MFSCVDFEFQYGRPSHKQVDVVETYGDDRILRGFLQLMLHVETTTLNLTK